MGTWKFREIRRGDIKQDPREAEFFTEEGKPGALVREVIQNSLDAAVEGETVRVRFAFGHLDEGLEADVMRNFFEGLPPHLKSQEFVESNPLEEEELDYLVVEDFGTTGLVGDPRVYSDRDADPQNSFFWFWRNVGRSGKAESDLGRWGVGKTVFPTSSRMFSYFGLTTRRDDSRNLLMGLSVMKTHSIGQTEFRPYGYFARFEDGFPLPIEEPEAIQKFRSFFRLSREDQSGLSVVIPYPKEEITRRSIQAAIVREFFFPVLDGSLEVVVEDASETVVIDRESLVERALEVSWAEFDEDEDYIYDLLDFTEAALESQGSPDAELRCAGADGAPTWNDSRFEEVDLEALRGRWKDGELTTVRVPIMVKPVDGADVESHFTIFLKQDDSLASGDSYFIRSGLVVPDAGKAIPGRVRAMAVIDASDLVALLGDAENPAHRKWTEASERLKKDYRHGPFTVRFVNNSLREMCQRLITPPEGLDEEILSDIFYIERPQETEGDDRERTDGGDVNVDGSPQPFRVTRRTGGFRITKNDAFDGKVDGGRVRAAYDVASGNPFSKYKQWDFRFGEDIDIEITGCMLKENGDNELVFRITGDEAFELIAMGFDERRDVIVDAASLD